MIYALRTLIALLFVATFSAAQAEPLVINEQRQYAFELPEGWARLDQTRFRISGPAQGVFIDELEVNEKSDSLESFTRISALAIIISMPRFKDSMKTRKVNGKNWNGRIKELVGPSSTLLQLTVTDGLAYRLFYLTVPNEEYENNKGKYVEALSTLLFPYP